MILEVGIIIHHFNFIQLKKILSITSIIMIPFIMHYNKLQIYKNDLFKKYSDFYNCELKYNKNYILDYNMDIKNLYYHKDCKDKYELLNLSFNKYYKLLESYP